MLEQVDVRWSERRVYPDGTPELFLMHAQRITGVWSFFERSTWESRWYRSSGTVEHMVAAENAAIEQAPRPVCPCLKKRRRYYALWASMPPTAKRSG